MNIIEALDDPNLFGPHFRGDTWEPWRAFLAALFGLPMTEAQADLYRQHTGRQALPSSASTEAALICGRRAGKSRVLALTATYLACFKDYSEHLAPGEVATVAVVAATQKQARTIFRYISGAVNSIGLLKGMVENETADSIVLDNRVVIEIAVASFRVTRGYTYAAFLADEVAFWRSDESANPDEEIITAVRPGLSTIPGAMLLLASSPYAMRGVLHKTFQRHYGKDGARVLVWKASTRRMNSAIDQAIIDEAYEEDPEGAAAEYGGEFRSDISSFLSREIVEGCTIPGRFELPPRLEYGSGKNYVAFVDPSGGSADSMTMAIAHAEGNVGVLDVLRERKPPFSPDDVVQDFAATLKAYGISTVHGDRYAGEWPRERFRVAGITYEVSERNKNDIYKEALPLLNSGRVELLDSTRLTQQLCSLERRTARGGRDSIDHPPGLHDDLANSAAGALVLAAGKLSSLDAWLKAFAE